MFATVEGVYKNGQVRLSEKPPAIQEARVLVTFLKDGKEAKAGRRMAFGQFAGERMSTDEDFRLAEWRGEDGNRLGRQTRRGYARDS